MADPKDTLSPLPAQPAPIGDARYTFAEPLDKNTLHEKLDALCRRFPPMGEDETDEEWWIRAAAAIAPNSTALVSFQAYKAARTAHNPGLKAYEITRCEQMAADSGRLSLPSPMWGDDDCLCVSFESMGSEGARVAVQVEGRSGMERYAAGTYLLVFGDIDTEETNFAVEITIGSDGHGEAPLPHGGSPAFLRFVTVIEFAEE